MIGPDFMSSTDMEGQLGCNCRLTYICIFYDLVLMQILDWCLIVSPEAGIVRGGVGQQKDFDMVQNTQNHAQKNKEHTQ